MSSQQLADENTPLLKTQQVKKTPLPWGQFSLMMMLQLAEPLTSQVLYPFCPQLIRELGITNGDESRVGFYVGVMQSLFFATQAITVLNWSRLSDTIGRKPVILLGLSGLSLSMYLFGLSRTFWGLVISRCLNGALNGNIGVLKSVITEITDSTNLADAYAYMPIAWSTGSFLGPLIGGSLSRPTEHFPDIFGGNTFLTKYPYFLPCSVPATFTLLAWFMTLLFFKETVPTAKSVSQLFKVRKDKKDSYPSSISSMESDSTNVKIRHDKSYTITELLIPRVIIAGINYASLSFVDISYRAVQPIFFSTPIELGGLGLAPPAIGRILSCFGICNGLVSVFFFAKIHDTFGTKNVFLTGLISAIPIFGIFPILNAVARVQGLSTLVWVGISLQIVCAIFLNLSYGELTFFSFGLGCVFIYISAAAPNRASLGSTNGIAQCFVSITRACGPAIANTLFSLSMERNYFRGCLVYYVLTAFTFVAISLGCLLPRKLWDALI